MRNTTDVPHAEDNVDYVFIGLGSVGVLVGLFHLLTPPLVPIDLLGTLSALGGGLLLSAGLLDRREGWTARTTALVGFEVLAAVVAVLLVVVLHILPL